MFWFPSTFIRLANFLKGVGSDRDPISMVEEAIEYWVDNASWKTDDLLPELAIKHPGAGYTWKIRKEGSLPPASLFLQDCSSLRIKVGAEYQYAHVRGDQIEYASKRGLSPSQFASDATGTQRDAWRDVWIKRPTDSAYHLAGDLREEVRPSR